MTVGQISRDQMALSSKTQRLSKPFHAAAQHENFGAGAEKLQRDGVPDISRRPRDQSNRMIEAHLLLPGITP